MKVFVCVVVCCVLVPCQMSIAEAVDLTAFSSQAMVNDAIFVQINENNSSGSGVATFGSFLRIRSNGSEAGYNTDGSLEFNTQTGTHSLLLSAVPVVNVAGTDYREFSLDVNEVNNAANKLISLDALQISLASDPALSGYSSIFSSVIYDLDAGEDNWIGMDYSLNSGSGEADLSVLVPSALFGADESQYVYLYSELGLNNSTSDGFEEWGVGVSGTGAPASIVDASTVIPEPATLLLVGLGGLLLRRIRIYQI